MKHELPKPAYEVTDDNHKYSAVFPTGERVGPLKSVTTLLQVLAKPLLVGWAAREAAGYFKTELLRLGRSALTPEMLDQIAKDAAMAHRRKSTTAMDLGTRVHAICQAIIEGKEPADVPPELVEPTKDFKAYRLASDIEIVAMELPVASTVHGFGGRIDAVGYSAARGGWGIMDIKTSKSLDYGNEYSYQVGGYALALAEQYGITVSWGEIVRFGKVEPYDSEARLISDMAAASAGFINVVAMAKSNAVKLLGATTFSTSKGEAIKAPIKSKRSKAVLEAGF